MTTSRRGKFAEGKIRDFLEQWKQTHVSFTYNRILDAGSAKGAMSTPQPGDFQWFLDMGLNVRIRRPAQPGESLLAPALAKLGLPCQEVIVNDERRLTRNGLIECKQTEHAFRLPFGSFGVDQVGRMRIRALAGSECIVLICYHTTGTRGSQWRKVPLEFFETRDGPKFGSWDLSKFTTQPDVAAILEDYLT